MHVTGVADGECLYTVPGAAGYKGHAFGLAALPLPDTSRMSPWEIWQQGRVHVVMGTSSVGHTRYDARYHLANLEQLVTILASPRNRPCKSLISHRSAS